MAGGEGRHKKDRPCRERGEQKQTLFKKNKVNDFCLVSCPKLQKMEVETGEMDFLGMLCSTQEGKRSRKE